MVALESLEPALSLSGIEFIRDKTKAGDWVNIKGAIDVLTNTISYIPANGKTLFLYSAKIVSTGNSNASSYQNQVQAELKIDGVTEDTVHVGEGHTRETVANGGSGTALGMGGAGDTKSDRFDVSGLSLVGMG